jgi:hypothetical protein
MTEVALTFFIDSSVTFYTIANAWISLYNICHGGRKYSDVLSLIMYRLS